MIQTLLSGNPRQRFKQLSRRQSVLMIALLTIGIYLLPIDAHSAPKSEPKLTVFTAPLLDVVDGDTIRVKRGRRRELVRLIGIDAPEFHKNQKAYRDSQRSRTSLDTIVGLGERSTNFVKSIITPGVELKIELGEKRRDLYDRSLAYVYLPDGRMLNEVLLLEGYATLMTSPANLRYVDRLRAAAQRGRRSARGNWLARQSEPQAKQR